MGLFSKKPPCVTCGGKISWFLPPKIEGEYICHTCFSKIDMEANKLIDLSLDDFRKYLIFHDGNQGLKDQCIISQSVDLELWNTKIVFDYERKLFCMSKNLDKTVFEGKYLKSIIVKEDDTPIFEGSVEGLYRYTSSVPERAKDMTPEITQFILNREMKKRMHTIENEQNDSSSDIPSFSISEPFRSFNVELHLDHPYWSLIRYDLDGPRFNHNMPNVGEYLRDYRTCMEQIEFLIEGFEKISFSADS